MPSKKSKKNIVPPDSSSNLSTVVNDFTKDLSITFPEYLFLWEKWTQPLDADELSRLHHYFSKTFPERFFDILYQNEDIFLTTSEVNTFFLPNVEFKFLYNCENITATTKTAIWKYLQLILFTLTPSFKNRANFGDSANLFEGIDETELQSKITEAISGMGDFFKDIRQNVPTPTTREEEEKSNEDENGEEKQHYSDSSQRQHQKPEYTMPNPNNIFDNLKDLFEGKIGKLAKELAGEMSEEFKDIFGDLGEEEGKEPDTQDIFKKMMKDPKKIMGLIQKLTVKLKSKFQSGELNQDDMMKEAGDFMKQFKDMGGAGSDQFKEMFQNMTKGMGLGKNVRMNTTALTQMEKKMQMRERIQKNLEKKRAEMAAVEEAKNNNIQMGSDGSAVFRLDGGEKQEKTSKEEIDRIMREMNLTNEIIAVPNGGVDASQKKKKKKAKK